MLDRTSWTWKRYATVLRTKPGQPLASVLFTYVAAVCAAVTVWVLARHVPWHPNWPGIVYLCLLSVVCELFPVSLPKTGKVSVGFSINFAALLLFGPLPAVIVSAVGVLTAGLIRALPLDYWLFNTSEIALAAAAAGGVYLAIGGRPGYFEDLHTQVGLLVATSFAYFLVNTFLFTLVIALEEKLSVWRMWTSNVRWTVPNYLALSCLGLLGAVSYKSPLGAVGVGILFIPLLLARYGFQRFIDVRDAHLETVRALAAALDAKDPYTKGHSDRVADLSVRIAREMGLPEESIEVIHHAAILHDVGKISIHDALLNKEGKLEPDEYKLIQTHAAIGADIVGRSPFFKHVSEIVRHHHEWYNGRGYPEGLQGENIPIGGRIVGVADAFDAMVTDRAYRKGLTREDALERILIGRGVQFDPNVVDALLRYLKSKEDGNAH